MAVKNRAWMLSVDFLAMGVGAVLLLGVLGEARAQSPSGLEFAVPVSPISASVVPPALLLAKELPAHVRVGDYLISEKYDGVRAFWDGRVLRFRGGGVVAARPAHAAAQPSARLIGL